MAIIGINLSDTIGTWVTQFDNLGLNVGDLTLLTTDRDSNLVAAINSLDSQLSNNFVNYASLDSAHFINLSAVNFALTNLDVDSASFRYLSADDFDADSARIVTLSSSNAKVNDFDADSARILVLSSNNVLSIYAKINDFDADSARIVTLSSSNAKVNDFDADSARIVTLSSLNAKANNFDADSAVIVTLFSTTATIDNITITNLNGDSATFSGDVNAANFNSTSDIKFKENVISLENSINTINQIRPVSFNWIGGNKSYGVIAQELEQILPELVNEDQYGIKRVSYTPIIALLIDAIKAHEVEIQKLKNCQCNCK